MHRKGGWESSVGTEHVEYETESRVVVLGQSTIALNGGMHPLVRLSHADLLNPREVQVDLEDRVTARFEATAFHATEADMQRVVISGFRSTCETVQGHKTTSGECPRAARAPIAIWRHRFRVSVSLPPRRACPCLLPLLLHAGARQTALHDDSLSLAAHLPGTARHSTWLRAYRPEHSRWQCLHRLSSARTTLDAARR